MQRNDVVRYVLELSWRGGRYCKSVIIMKGRDVAFESPLVFLGRRSRLVPTILMMIGCG